MRVLIYDVQADRYFQSAENWTSDPALATDFKGTVKAVTAAFLCRLKNVDVILDFEEAQLKMHLPLPAGG
jgi:hypothetical protein